MTLRLTVHPLLLAESVTAVSTPGEGQTNEAIYYLGGPPIIGPQTAIAQLPMGICAVPIPETEWITDVRIVPTDPRRCGNISWLNVPGNIGEWTYQTTIVLPAGVALSGTINVAADGQIRYINLNGHRVVTITTGTVVISGALYGAGSSTYAGSIDPTFINTGTANTLEIAVMGSYRGGSPLYVGTSSLCYTATLAVSVARNKIRHTVPAGLTTKLVHHG